MYHSSPDVWAGGVRPAGIVGRPATFATIFRIYNTDGGTDWRLEASLNNHRRRPRTEGV